MGKRQHLSGMDQALKFDPAKNDDQTERRQSARLANESSQFDAGRGANLVATSTSSSVAVLRTLPEIVMSALETGG